MRGPGLSPDALVDSAKLKLEDTKSGQAAVKTGTERLSPKYAAFRNTLFLDNFLVSKLP